MREREMTRGAGAVLVAIESNLQQQLFWHGEQKKSLELVYTCTVVTAEL